MKFNKIIYLITIIFLLFSCAKEKIKQETLINENQLDLQVLESYQSGLKYLEEGDVLFAAKKFNEVEELYPQSNWAPKSALMAAYAYYSQDYYSDAIFELKRFIKIYPNHKNLDYANYLLALSYYEQIVDEKKDTSAILKAKQYFNIVVRDFSGTDYELDSKFKLDLIDDILASKEMHIGRYYVNKKKWVPAINRFKTVINDYDTTIYVEEALHRLVEVHYILGLKEESQRYARLLGYNYKSSEWYENSYSVFDKMYKKKKLKKDKNKKSLISKAKSLFN